MKIVYSGTKYHHGVPEYGYTFEYLNFYETLKNMPNVEVIYFPYDREREIGAKKLNKELIDLVAREKPDLFFAHMPHVQISTDTLDEVRKHALTCGWFGDDHWIFYRASRYWAPHFNWVATTYSPVIPEYHKIGCKNVIRTQLAVNTKYFKPSKEFSPKKSYEVTFVGGGYPARLKLVKKILKAGIQVHAWGDNWPQGLIEEREIPALFSQSKINLDINPPASGWDLKSLALIFFRRKNNLILPDFGNIYNNIRQWLGGRISVLKVRTFEAMACGGFVIATDSEDLRDYYVPGKEIVTYSNNEDLINKIRYYLHHDDERKAIARAGYERTLREHTFEKRFSEIFKAIGL